MLTSYKITIQLFNHFKLFKKFQVRLCPAKLTFVQCLSKENRMRSFSSCDSSVCCLWELSVVTGEMTGFGPKQASVTESFTIRLKPDGHRSTNSCMFSQRPSDATVPSPYEQGNDITTLPRNIQISAVSVVTVTKIMTMTYRHTWGRNIPGKWINNHYQIINWAAMRICLKYQDL